MMINFIQILNWSGVLGLCNLPPLILKSSVLASNRPRDTKPKKRIKGRIYVSVPITDGTGAGSQLAL